MARSAPKGKKGAKPAPKSKKPVEKVEDESEQEEVKSEEDEAPEDKPANNGNSAEDSEGEDEEPPAKKGRGRPAAKAKGGKKTPAKKGGRASSRARKTPAKKEESEEEDEKEYEVQSILQERTKKGVKEYLVKWKGYKVSQATWEPVDNLNCDDAITEYEEKKKEGKTGSSKELREVPKQTERYADIAGSGDKGRRHSRRNKNSPRKTYREAADSD